MSTIIMYVDVHKFSVFDLSDQSEAKTTFTGK